MAKDYRYTSKGEPKAKSVKRTKLDELSDVEFEAALNEALDKRRQGESVHEDEDAA
jgi:hypothetical protein